MESPDRRFLLGGFAGAAGVAALARLSSAGPLNPPAGTVAATGKTLTSVEPRTEINSTNTPGDGTVQYRISSPGSYYLSGQLLGESGKNGIAVSATNVTIDLNGFTMQGVPGAGFAVGGLTGFHLRNGVIADWPTYASAGLPPQVRYSDLTVVNCGSGLGGGVASLAERCTVRASSAGINFGAGSVVVDCVVTAVGSGTSWGIACGAGGLVSRCSVNGFQNGISVTSGSVTGCVVENAVYWGIFCNGDGLIEGNACRANSSGILVGGRGRVVGNMVTGSTSTVNGGIVITSSGCHIDGNTLVGNYTNLRITGSFNLVTRNTMAFSGAGGNSVIAANNSVSPIVNAANGGSPATTDSFANIGF